MSEVFWRRNKPDHEDVVWTDLLDRKIGTRKWVVTYRESGDKWLVLYLNHHHFRKDEYIDKATMSEEQLRHTLKLDYILRRGET